MQIFNIHKQVEFTKNNGHVGPIVYRIKRPCTKGHATLTIPRGDRGGSSPYKDPLRADYISRASSVSRADSCHKYLF